MRADYEFLKSLETKLGPSVEELNETTNANNSPTYNDILENKEEIKETVKAGLHFLEDREEFWTNVK